MLSIDFPLAFTTQAKITDPVPRPGIRMIDRVATLYTLTRARLRCDALAPRVAQRFAGFFAGTLMIARLPILIPILRIAIAMISTVAVANNPTVA